MEWDEQERAWMLALTHYRDSRCPNCNGDLAVTTAPENEDRFKAQLPVTCFRCEAFSRSRKAYQDEPHPTALLHLVACEPG